MKTYSTFWQTFFNVLNAQDKRMVKRLEMLSVVQKVQILSNLPLKNKLAFPYSFDKWLS